jgi:hypothetical protein
MMMRHLSSVLMTNCYPVHDTIIVSISPAHEHTYTAPSCQSRCSKLFIKKAHHAGRSSQGSYIPQQADLYRGSSCRANAAPDRLAAGIDTNHSKQQLHNHRSTLKTHR